MKVKCTFGLVKKKQQWQADKQYTLIVLEDNDNDKVYSEQKTPYSILILQSSGMDS